MMVEDEAEAAEAISRLKSLQESFQKEPSIDNYVALRRYAPRVDEEIYRFAAVEPLTFLSHELERLGLNSWLVCGALDGNDRDADELCLQILERIISRNQLEAQGHTHLQGRGNVISDGLISHLIVALVEALQRHSLEPMPSLVLLIREQLGGANTDIYKSFSKWESMNRAIILGMQLRRRGVRPSVRPVAAIMGVQPSTVSRWFPKGDFLQKVADTEAWFVDLGSKPCSSL
jgi:hypothetical protein